MRPRLRIALAAVAGLLGTLPAQAAEVEVTNTVLLHGYPQARYGASPLATDTIAPAYELLSITARNVPSPIGERLELVFSGWGAANLGSNPWWNGYGNDGAFSGDLQLLFVKADFAKGALGVRLGRQQVAGGNSRMLQLDGASVLWRMPFGLSLSAFGGSPVSARFDRRGGDHAANPIPGDVAAGGRIGYALPVFEVGLSALALWDRGTAGRQEAGMDLRLSPLTWLTLLASGTAVVEDFQVAAASVSAIAQASRAVSVSADYNYTLPSLFLPRDSILWVFTDSSREDVGASVHLAPSRFVSLDAGGAYLVTQDGYRVGGRATWRPARRTSLGADLSYLSAKDNAYFLGRVFGARDLGLVEASLDLQAMSFDKAVNGENSSLLAIASLGRRLGRSFTVAVSGSAGVTPYYQSFLQVMAKLVYQSFPPREVRP